MKKFFLSIIFCFVALFTCFAQVEHRISFGVGVFSHAYLSEFFSEFDDVDRYYPSPYDEPCDDYEYTDKWICSLPFNANLHYELAIGKHFGVGLCAGYDYIRMKHETEIIQTNTTEQNSYGSYNTWDSFTEYGRLHRHILYFMPEVYVYWFKRSHVAMYSKIGAGMRFNIEKKTYVHERYQYTRLEEKHFYFHAAPVGVEFGGQKWRGFAEIGYGAQGITQYGVRYTIKGKEKESNTEE